MGMEVSLEIPNKFLHDSFVFTLLLGFLTCKNFLLLVLLSA